MANALRYRCRSCHIKTGPAAFENVDDEFDPTHPLCPACKEDDYLCRMRCEFCDEPAHASTDAGPLCVAHFEHYVSAYLPRD